MAQCRCYIGYIVARRYKFFDKLVACCDYPSLNDLVIFYFHYFVDDAEVIPYYEKHYSLEK